MKEFLAELVKGRKPDIPGEEDPASASASASAGAAEAAAPAQLHAPQAVRPLPEVRPATPPLAGPMPGVGAVPNLGPLFAQRGAYGHTGLVRPPGLPNRHGAAGAGEGSGTEGLARILQAGEEQRHTDNERIIHALDGLRRDGEDEKVSLIFAPLSPSIPRVLNGPL